MKNYLHENFFEGWILYMLYYDRIDTSKGIDPTKNNKSRECMIYLFFFF